MKVYVPSMGRAERLVQKGMTVNWIEKGYLVVPEAEVAAYKRTAPHGWKVLGCPKKGIAATRHWIGKHAREKGRDKFLMCDDDLSFAVRRAPDDWRLNTSTPQDVREMLEWVEDKLDDYPHVGVAMRGGSHQYGGGLFLGSREELVRYNTRSLRFLAYRTEEFLSVKHGRVPVMEDFDVNLQLLRSGNPNAVTFHWTQQQRETGTLGGCSSYRTLELQAQAAHKLAELHPGLVKVVKKVAKHAMSDKAREIAERTDVRIEWMKAAEEGGCW